MNSEQSLLPPQPVTLQHLLSQQRAQDEAHENILLAASERRGRDQGLMWLAEMGIDIESEEN